MSTGLRTSNRTNQPMHKDNPEVIVVNISVSGSRLGGAAIAAEWHSRFLAKNASVELWRMWDSDSSFWLENLKIRNFETRPRCQSITRKLPRRAKALIFESDILPQLLESGPKIVHLQNPGPALEFERIAKTCQENGIKVVASTHGFYEVFYPNYGLKWYERIGWQEWLTKPIQRSFPHIDAFLSGYPAEKKLLLKNGVPEDKIHLVPNGINPYFESVPTDNECKTVLKKFGIDKNKPILLFIGNHTANKGIDTVLHVAAHLKIPSTVVIGGKLLSADEPAQRLSLMPTNRSSDVIFTDYLTNLEQRVLYHLATVLLFPSLADTLPLTILEAMACSLPVIAYDTGGISYQLMDQAGIIVPQGDTSAFLNAVDFLLCNPDIQQKIASYAKNRQQSLFSWNLATQKTLEIYSKINPC